MRLGLFVAIAIALISCASAFTPLWGRISPLKPAHHFTSRLRCNPAVHAGDSSRIHEDIKDIIASNDVVLFMKGEKNKPQCGFSAKACQVLQQVNVPFMGVNVLSDPTLRSAVKEYSKWPTFPQLYVRGELVGGCDIMSEMLASGELATLIHNEHPSSSQ